MCQLVRARRLLLLLIACVAAVPVAEAQTIRTWRLLPTTLVPQPGSACPEGWTEATAPTDCREYHPLAGSSACCRYAPGLIPVQCTEGCRGGGAQPVITVTGPEAGAIDTTHRFVASVTGCTPGTWEWTLSGGGRIVEPGRVANTVSAQWSTSGVKTVTATNAACGGASGSWFITIGGGGEPRPWRVCVASGTVTYTPGVESTGRLDLVLIEGECK